MTALDLFEAMQLSGVAMVRDGDRLNLKGPANFIDAFLPEIQRFKPALLELLAAPTVPLVVVARDAADVLGQRIEAMFNHEFSDDERAEYHAALVEIESQIERTNP